MKVDSCSCSGYPVEDARVCHVRNKRTNKVSDNKITITFEVLSMCCRERSDLAS